MNTRFTGTCIGIMAIGMLVTGAIVYPHLPLTLASHWDVSGQVNGTMSRFWGTFLLPIMAIVLWGLWALLPRIDPIAKGFNGFRYVYDFFWVILTAFFAYVYALSLGANLGLVTNMSTAIIPAVGVLIFSLGALLPRVKRNWFFGIRTPWTLSSDAVWDKTHRFASPLFMIAGLATLLALLDPTKVVALWLMFTLIALAAIISVVYSYVLSKRELQD